MIGQLYYRLTILVMVVISVGRSVWIKIRVLGVIIRANGKAVANYIRNNRFADDHLMRLFAASC
jgi:hypothetical protein